MLKGELFADGSPTDGEVLAYENRYADERDDIDLITGLLNSKNGTALDYWHLAQELGAAPTYNSSYIKSSTPMDRVLAITDTDHIFLDFRLEKTEHRILPLYGNPFQLSRF